ncbi:hypothetical protein BLOT_004423 [Blomia tropicalis]|nr:hypothetical protein BLOT_004423 [Blomia tropicalis]
MAMAKSVRSIHLVNSNDNLHITAAVVLSLIGQQLSYSVSVYKRISNWDTTRLITSSDCGH